MDRISGQLPTVLMLALGVVGSLVSIAWSFLRHWRIRKNIEFESRRQYFPLDFDNCKRFRVMKQPGVAWEYAVIDLTGSVAYTFHNQVMQSWWRWLFYDKWTLTDSQKREIALITKFRLNWLDDQMVFFLREPQGPSLMNTASATEPTHIGTHSPARPLVYPVGYSIPITPYIDPDLTSNRAIHRHDLGPTVEMPVPFDLLKPDQRSSHKLKIYYNAERRQATFQVSRGSIRYKWVANGYLYKFDKFEVDPTSIPVALVQVGGIAKNPTEFMLYVNAELIDDTSVLCTALVGFLSGIWTKKKSSYN
ncbi:uncharacterized protein CYBJADRAFT_171432 [Cyberlindnera jadinii NRRL Y-1542]|uniref:Uncharacterized protein n=1 Tax=Cyberlindnera jadinii (strain ATCC 18201 / CBS 1600 / BCRC 20928 / JCM 3617 / NBRC 0987 / NRRL Y-1542) TaxID=983966 RepID=A0A1E4S7Q8_CYBJN|nr:hypothetical protein CYBJADRAFT_171432 [Cyberlindnera jadinii NRRL Y-1542]ODV75520.1 hypothetical protein CYBJADRAFT_171432 [Cyberlindnera jadinii NRRL Y-1542]